MSTHTSAEDIIESLREGIPPANGISTYSVGNEKLLGQIKFRHLKGDSSQRGKIRFISGSWGSGKSHFLRQLREEAFKSNYLVSSFGLNADEAPFNKFEKIFYHIVRNISSSEMTANLHETPLAEVFRLHLVNSGASGNSDVIAHDTYSAVSQALMQNTEIDIDFRRLVCRYWETFLPESGDPELLEDRRGQIMQWFTGESPTIGAYRKEYGVQKLVKRDNARLLLKSLGRFAAHAGYAGIVILLDEAEMSYSVMRKSDLKKAHNNLLHLINNIEESPGLFLVYATTPDFYADEKHGIRTYGALAQRIGQPEQKEPRALDRIWNLDSVSIPIADYKTAAQKLRLLYLEAFPEARDLLLSEAGLDKKVEELHDFESLHSPVGFWRILITSLIDTFDLQSDGEEIPETEELYDNTMNKLRDY